MGRLQISVLLPTTTASAVLGTLAWVGTKNGLVSCKSIEKRISIRRVWVCALTLCSTIVGTRAQSVAQAGDPISIRVESNVVLVPTAVLDKRLTNSSTWETKTRQCEYQEWQAFLALQPSEPFLPKHCAGAEMYGLTARDFHVFEDGVEQKIQSVAIEPWHLLTVRDNVGQHFEWSYTQRGKWSTSDLSRANYWPALREEFYNVAYVPSHPEAGGCHRIQVRVDRSHAIVYSRDRYCHTPNPAYDPLSGTPLGGELEAELRSSDAGKIPFATQAVFFYTGINAARVYVTLEFLPSRLKHTWIEGQFSFQDGVLGLVQRRDRTLAARFSDLATCLSAFLMCHLSSDLIYGDTPLADVRLRAKILDPAVLPARYETQVDLSPGEYDLLLVLSDGSKFGRIDIPLVIDAYDGKQLALSSIALCKRARDAKVAAQESAAVSLAPQYVPLVSNGLQVTPAADARFERGGSLIAYFELYEPLLAGTGAVNVQFQTRILDARTGGVRIDTGLHSAVSLAHRPSSVIPIAEEIKLSKLTKGAYRLEVQAIDSGRDAPIRRSADFTID